MFGFLGAKNRTNKPEDPPAGETAIDTAKIVELMRCFPIGAKVRYFPEFRKDIILDSIIIAYGINNRLIYTQNDIHVRDEADAPVLLLDDDWKDETVRDVRRFCFIIPDIGNLEYELDYTSRAELANNGQIQRGDHLTLMSLFNNRGVPHIDTHVRKRVTLKEGYYANHAVIVLEALPDSLDHVDQRQQARVKSNLPVKIRFSNEAEWYPCVLTDFSESSLKIGMDEDSAALAMLTPRKTVFVHITALHQDREFELKGKVLRKGEGFAVITLGSILKGEEFRSLELLDALDLKASLLQVPAAR